MLTQLTFDQLIAAIEVSIVEEFTNLIPNNITDEHLEWLITKLDCNP